jgi:hypothetical protein
VLSAFAPFTANSSKTCASARCAFSAASVYEYFCTFDLFSVNKFDGTTTSAVATITCVTTMPPASSIEAVKAVTDFNSVKNREDR